jgi:hypothetical protein
MIEQEAGFCYWAMIGQLPNSKGGYLGLQTNSSGFDGSMGDKAIFSIWGAMKADDQVVAHSREKAQYTVAGLPIRSGRRVNLIVAPDFVRVVLQDGIPFPSTDVARAKGSASRPVGSDSNRFAEIEAEDS